MDEIFSEEEMIIESTEGISVEDLNGRSIFFHRNSATISFDVEANFRDYIHLLTKVTQIIITGLAEEGENDYKNLSKQRANSFKDYLIKNGVDASKMLISSLADEDKPVFDKSENGNSRVEIIIIE